VRRRGPYVVVVVAFFALVVFANTTPSAAHVRSVSRRLAVERGCPRKLPRLMQGFRLEKLADLSDAGRCGVVWTAVSTLTNTEPAVRALLERGDTTDIVIWIHEFVVPSQSADRFGVSAYYFEPPIPWYDERSRAAYWVVIVGWRGPNPGHAEVWLDKRTGIARQRRSGRRPPPPR
jgi:hypothetical protein